jgi:ferredoxin
VRVKIDAMGCIASGACRRNAPAVFGQDEDGLVALLQPDPPAALHPAVRAAAVACPAAAIAVEDD